MAKRKFLKLFGGEETKRLTAKEINARNIADQETAKLTQGTDEILKLDDAAVYPDGKGMLQAVGSKVRAGKEKVGGALSGASTTVKKSVAKELVGSDSIRAGIKESAEKTIKPVVSFHKAVDNFQTGLSDSIKSMESGFKSSFKKYDMQSTSQPNRILDGLDKLTNQFHGQKGIPVIRDLEDIVKGVRNGEITPSKGLRKYRSLTGRLLNDSRQNKGPKELRNAEMSLTKLQNEARQLFRTQADLVAKDTKNPSFAKEVKSLDDRYSKHFAFKKNKAIFRAGDGSNTEAHNILSKIQSNPKKAPHTIDEFMADMKTLESLSGSKGFANSQMDNLKDAMGSHLFHGEGSSTFKNYLTHPSGRSALNKLWPEHKGMFDEWATVFKQTEGSSGKLESWISRIIGMGIGGGVGTVMGGGAGAAVGGAVGAFVASSVFKSKPFQRWAIKQFSEKPDKPGMALSKLTKMLKGDQAQARRIMDSMLGGATLGVAGTLTYQGLKPSDQDKSDAFDRKFGVQKKYKVNKSFDAKFGIIPE